MLNLPMINLCVLGVWFFSGYGLAFKAYPEVLSNFPAPQFWSVIFFLMLFTLGLDSEVMYILKLYLIYMSFSFFLGVFPEQSLVLSCFLFLCSVYHDCCLAFFRSLCATSVIYRLNDIT